MPKLNLDKNFINKLNSINRDKIKPDLPKSKSTSKFKINQDNTPFMPENPYFKKEKKDNEIEKKEIEENNLKREYFQTNIKNNDIKLKRLVLKNITDTEMMWDSFDNSVKKIVLSEIIEKYYLYKIWKINTISFIIGFILALFIILIVFLVINIIN